MISLRDGKQVGRHRIIEPSSIYGGARSMPGEGRLLLHASGPWAADASLPRGLIKRGYPHRRKARTTKSLPSRGLTGEPAAYGSSCPRSQNFVRRESCEVAQLRRLSLAPLHMARN